MVRHAARDAEQFNGSFGNGADPHRHALGVGVDVDAEGRNGAAKGEQTGDQAALGAAATAGYKDVIDRNAEVLGLGGDFEGAAGIAQPAHGG